MLLSQSFQSDVKCPTCGRWAAQHGDLTICSKTENEILRVELGRLQSTVSYLFTIREGAMREEIH